MSCRTLQRLIPLAAWICLVGTRIAPAQEGQQVLARANATQVSVAVIEHRADGTTVRDETGERARARQAQFVNSEWVMGAQELVIRQGEQVLLRARVFPTPDLTYWVVSSLKTGENQAPTQVVNGTIHLNPSNMTIGFSRLFLTDFAAGGTAVTTLLEANLQVAIQ